MLDTNRLFSIPLLQQNGWKPVNKTDLKQRYEELERKYQKNQSICNLPQVALTEIFPVAKEVIEIFEGICIKNFHSELGMGKDSNIIEFSFFEYDRSNISDLQKFSNQIQERLLFIGIGYDIIGDWLIAESVRIYFFNKISDMLHLVSENIYEFFERDIYTLRGINSINILNNQKMNE